MLILHAKVALNAVILFSLMMELWRLTYFPTKKGSGFEWNWSRQLLMQTRKKLILTN